jgi:hypothetical protein
MHDQQAAQGSLVPVAQIPFLDGGVGTIILIVLVVLVLVAGLFLVIRVVQGRQPPGQQPPGEGSWREYGSLYVVLWGILAVGIGFLSVLLVVFLGGFKDVNQALGFLTAFFGAIVGLVGTYFGIKTSADATRGAQDQATKATNQAVQAAAQQSPGQQPPGQQPPGQQPPHQQPPGQQPPGQQPPGQPSQEAEVEQPGEEQPDPDWRTRRAIPQEGDGPEDSRPPEPPSTGR